MTPENRQSLFIEELSRLCDKYGVVIKAIVQEEQLGPKKLLWAVPTLELDPKWAPTSERQPEAQANTSAVVQPGRLETNS